MSVHFSNFIRNTLFYFVLFFSIINMEKFLNIESKRKQNEDNCKEENKRKFRKYDNNYLDFGFTYITIDNEERPKCIICLKVLAADSMVQQIKTSFRD